MTSDGRRQPAVDSLTAGAPTSMPAERRVVILGSTGSIGTQTLDVIEHLNALHRRGEWPTRYTVVGLAARASDRALFDQAHRFDVADVALADETPAAQAGARALHDRMGERTRVRFGSAGPEKLIREVDCDLVVGAMVGAAGLPATLAAVELGRDVALANKETLVAAGSLIVPAARRTGARLLPVDSEHAAVWQCLQGADGRGAAPPEPCADEVARVVLTASGGPFRTWTREKAYHASPQEALRHPTWTMGAKVTIDSASLTNKAFEVIEAHWLFGLSSARIGVLIHPQSVVHSLVEFADGGMIAQMGPNDMRLPIQYALTWPCRPPGRVQRLDLAALSRLDFEAPDHDRFPALTLAYRAIDEGGAVGAAFNAANEEAVHAFLAGHMPFGRIPELSRMAVDRLGGRPLSCLDDCLAVDAEARRLVKSAMNA